ncbi:MAG: outer membrane beta-barrel protein [Prevotella sp.]|nr:outer membrane beta-barrel protein [Prevotella sp.]MBP5508724.1 outer membrane beta-barrel protein [Prevotella sp.]
MIKKLSFLLLALAMTLTASAQFEQGKKYISASFSGLDFSYNGTSDLNVGFQAKGGYLLDDNLMLLGSIGYNHIGDDITPDRFSVGAEGRYYIIQNGIYLGAGATYKHGSNDYNDIMPTVEIGYAFFINRTVTIEPAIYYEQSLNDHSKYSNVGLRIGLGIYLF